MFLSHRKASLLNKVQASAGHTLGDMASSVFQGLITGADSVYILEDRGPSSSQLRNVFSRAESREFELEASLLKPLLSGTHVARYSVRRTSNLLLFPYELHADHAVPIPSAEFVHRFPRIWAYLDGHRKALEARDRGKMAHDLWYTFVRTQSLALHQYTKLAIPRLVQDLQAYYDEDGSFYLDNVDVGGVLLKEGARENYLYALALLNSQLLNFCFRQISVPFRGGFRSANRQFISPLPIKAVDPANPKDKACHDQLLALVQRMLDLHQRLPAKGNVRDEERAHIEREIARTDREIDDLVYDLYGLTAAERDLVEREMAR